MKNQKLEMRFKSVLEFREATDGGTEKSMPTLRGIAVPFGVTCADPVYGSFYERVDARAFDNCLASPDCDVIVPMFHMPEQKLPLAKFLGKRSNNTLQLRAQPDGLHFEFTLPNITEAHDLVEVMRRGDIDGVSVGMYVINDEWSGTYQGLELRTIKEAWLDHISIVNRQQYDTATASERSKGTGVMQKDDYSKLILEVRKKQAPPVPLWELSLMEMELQLLSIDA